LKHKKAGKTKPIPGISQTIAHQRDHPISIKRPAILAVQNKESINKKMK
jgi:hypothetical protein